MDNMTMRITPTGAITDTLVLDTDVLGNALVLCTLDNQKDNFLFAVVVDWAPDMEKWGPHEFYVTLSAALRNYPYNPISHASVRWVRDDFEQALNNFGILPTDAEVYALMRKVNYLKPWVDGAIADGWDQLNSAVSQLHPEAEMVSEDD